MILFELKRQILTSGLKQTHIARAIGLEPTILSKKINGHLGITEDEKLAISKVLGRKVKDLFPS